MLRVAIQVKELIASNVTSALDAASDPAKMLTKLQREVEEAIIALEGERGQLRQRKKQLEASFSQSELREADWHDKAKAAIDHNREDLARQALLAREDCREAIATLKDDISRAEAGLTELDDAVAELEAKRHETRDQLKTISDVSAPKSSGVGHEHASEADRQLDRIATLEKRTEFATDNTARACSNPSVDRDIAEMRREKSVEEELAAMKTASTPTASKRAVRKKKS